MHAGQFGEGVKVEINRLIQDGCTVEYRTGSMLWQFFNQREHSRSQQDLLHMRSVAQSTSQPDTSMIIWAPASSSLRPHEYLDLDETQFLFLRPAYDSYRCVAKDYGLKSAFGMEILYDERDVGKLFVRDIYVCTEPKLKGLGLNYLGTTKSSLGLSRYRTLVSVTTMMHELHELLSLSKIHKQAEHDRAAKQFLEILHQQPESSLRYLVVYGQRDTASDLYGVCQKALKFFLGMAHEGPDVVLLRPGQVRAALICVHISIAQQPQGHHKGRNFLKILDSNPQSKISHHRLYSPFLDSCLDYA